MTLSQNGLLETALGKKGRTRTDGLGSSRRLACCSKQGRPLPWCSLLSNGLLGPAMTGRFWLAVVGSLLLGGVTALATLPTLRIGDFSSQSPLRDRPDGWEQVRFGENESSTTYDLVRTDSMVVVRARSSNGASGLITHQRVDLSRYPILEWRWKVDRLPEGADVTKDTTADAAARLYVTFDYDGLGLIDRLKLMLLRRVGYSKAPSRALNYLWASRRGQDESVESPYTDQIMVMPVRSGPDRVGQWIRERRNVLADYRQVFGESPPAVNGVAIMTDTDNTADTARAFYGDIVFRAPSSRGDSMEAVSSGSE